MVNSPKRAAWLSAHVDEMKAWRAAYDIENKERIRAQRAEFRAANKERIRAQKAADYAANKDRIKARVKTRADANKEEINAKAAVRYIANKERDSEKRKAASRAYYAANKEKHAASVAAWVDANRDSARSIVRNRRARARSAEGSHTADDIARIRKAQKDRCCYCRKPLRGKGHVDHIVALSKGGSNWPSNLQMACDFCNCSKGPKDPVEFAQQRGLLL